MTTHIKEAKDSAQFGSHTFNVKFKDFQGLFRSDSRSRHSIIWETNSWNVWHRPKNVLLGLLYKYSCIVHMYFEVSVFVFFTSDLPWAPLGRCKLSSPLSNSSPLSSSPSLSQSRLHSIPSPTRWTHTGAHVWAKNNCDYYESEYT